MTTAFVIFGVLALGSALMVVVSRNPVVSALWLALTLASTAGVFLVLEAEFLFVMQLVIYAGAIMVFILFVVMLLNLGKRKEPADPHPWQFYLGLFGPVALALVLVFVTWNVRTELGTGDLAAKAVDNTRAIAVELFSRYLAPFEFVSVLLIVAMAGAVVLAWRRF